MEGLVMIRTELILITCMMCSVAAHGEVSLESQAKTLNQSRGFVRVEAPAFNADALAHDAIAAPTLIREWNVDHSNLTTGNGLASNSISASTMKPAQPDYGPSGRSDMWLIVLATIGLVTWQLWRKQKSLRFDQSCLAKDADYAVR
jgi:hypothetical protein